MSKIKFSRDWWLELTEEFLSSCAVISLIVFAISLVTVMASLINSSIEASRYITVGVWSAGVFVLALVLFLIAGRFYRRK